MRKKVILGMSGGVDSSVAAALLKRQGYEVIGVTLVLLPRDLDGERADACCGAQAVEDARAVCDQLDIRFHAANRREKFRTGVIDYFCDEYVGGRTPNPCVVCNRDIKFPELLRLAQILDADCVATGHYARIDRGESGQFRLLKGIDETKDQSYFLFTLTQAMLAKIIFPLGEMTKEEVRRLAGEMGLKVHGKPESQEVCFVAENRYDSFLKKWIPEKLQLGPIYDTAGRQIGQHKGIPLYTIGQRRGMGIAHKKPLYVLSIDAENNGIVAGPDEELLKIELAAGEAAWVSGESPSKPLESDVKIRYNHPGAKAVVTPLEDGRVKLVFEKPERAITPGQAAVFYRGETILGGAWIESSS
ncbi:MAG: tRNA 2-thiouridine(34) synthase MnmA [bacterium]|nr:tRNA 2-thiouridine(34) synthase MnmA [bacterium]